MSTDPPRSAADPLGPQGSAYEAAHPRRSSRTPWRRARRWASGLLLGVAGVVLPWLYRAYCWVLWTTARQHHDRLNREITAALAKHVGVVAILWHEEVFASAYAYGPLKGTALASTGTFGGIVSRLLERCGCEAFRGGSSRGGTRRREVLPDMIRHMNQASHCLYGLTVDGSRGPAYEVKTGALVIARACRVPIYAVRTWFSANLRLGTWDRTAIPLPFSRLHQEVVGPYWVSPEASDAALGALREHLQLELLELAERSLRCCAGDPGPPRAREGFPAGWQPRWAPGQRGVPCGPYDLRFEQPPPWARRRRPSEPRAI
ncbi:MAG: DUF374 domain-containing protein [Planctomycetes bacterium]|nr:DUF374 domain-containing protein [Planctomycetota bacterium]